MRLCIIQNETVDGGCGAKCASGPLGVPGFRAHLAAGLVLELVVLAQPLRAAEALQDIGNPSQSSSPIQLHREAFTQGSSESCDIYRLGFEARGMRGCALKKRPPWSSNPRSHSTHSASVSGHRQACLPRQNL